MITNPNVHKIKIPSVGFYLLAVSFVLAVASLIMYLMTYDAFHYSPDRLVTALMMITLWSVFCLMITGLFGGKDPYFADIFYIIAAACMTVAAVKFIIPCLSPIGIYFTVHNMGDVEANAIGVPRSIVCIVLCVLSVVSGVVSAFFKLSKEAKYD